MIVRKTFNSLILPSLRCNSAGTVQFYSVFPKNYMPPVFKKDELEQIYEEEKNEELAHVPIRPATNTDTCSEFHDPLVKKFTNCLMRWGKKELTRKIMDRTFENIKIAQLQKYYSVPPMDRNEIILDPKEILHRAVDNCTPVLELTKIMRGGIPYQVPVPMRDVRARHLAITWIIKSAKEKGNAEKLYDTLPKELIDAARNEGKAIRKKQEMHKQCEANRAYAHYRWL
ncbi:28S ribosomal protein S7, mitochondrial [Ceratina calcarata]|uniref:28S ribosomal protein S7, mitochondrial n=1 Tax=Ceratina calcarata TaxID=156304 RepID=A0AAJ7J0U9_9HYME|nr:28S ribosomal protein S7, mitochondrial [Ceratina calcarata]